MGWKLAVTIWGMALGGACVCDAGPQKHPPVNQEAKDAGFRAMFQSLFTQWDRNHDGRLVLQEINAAITDPSVRGNDSAVAVVLRRRLVHGNDVNTNGLSLDEMVALGSDQQMQRAITADSRHIASINHTLFATDDPSLMAFHQGGMGDCYLLAVVGAYVHHHSEAVRAMLNPGADGGFDVRFGNGKQAIVPPITDAELIMGAVEGRDHGVWLSVIEKAFARLRLNAKEPAEAEESVLGDVIGHGGTYAPVISLFTGHRTQGAPVGRWLKQDAAGAVDKMHELLTTLSGQHRVMAVCTGGDKTKTLPRGIPHGHVFAVLEYTPETRMVRMFNPWGNHFNPPGPPGMENGYLTSHGLFDVPIAEFMRVFGGFAYESDKPAGK